MLLTMDDVNNMYDTYKAADLNSDGEISRKEIVKAFKMDRNDEEKIMLMMKSLDTDRSGAVDFAEFMNWGS